MAVSVLWLFLAVSWVGLQCVNVVIPDHTHLLFNSIFSGTLLFIYYLLIDLLNHLLIHLLCIPGLVPIYVPINLLLFVSVLVYIRVCIYLAMFIG